MVNTKPKRGSTCGAGAHCVHNLNIFLNFKRDSVKSEGKDSLCEVQWYVSSAIKSLMKLGLKVGLKLCPRGHRISTFDLKGIVNILSCSLRKLTKNIYG